MILPLTDQVLNASARKGLTLTDWDMGRYVVETTAYLVDVGRGTRGLIYSIWITRCCRAVSPL